MKADKIFYGWVFVKQFERLPEKIRKLAVKKERLFRDNPLHPSLRLHGLSGKLAGLHSISITMNYRIIFKRMSNGDILFVSIGRHDIYNQ